MYDIPIIKIQIDGLRQSIQNAVAVHGKDFDRMITEAIDKSFTVETIQHKIDMQVAKALDNAIDSLSEQYQIKTIVKDIVLQSLVKKRDEIEKEKA